MPRLVQQLGIGVAVMLFSVFALNALPAGATPNSSTPSRPTSGIVGHGSSVFFYPPKLSTHDKNDTCTNAHGAWSIKNETATTQFVLNSGTSTQIMPGRTHTMCATPGTFVFTLKSDRYAKLVVTVHSN